MTGMYCTTLGAHHHRSHRGDGFTLPEGVHVFTKYLRDAGYFTCIPAGKKTVLGLVVANDPRGDWVLIVRADDKELLKAPISKATCKDGWREVSVDLSAWAGKAVTLKLHNQANGWSWEAGYWSKIAIESE